MDDSQKSSKTKTVLKFLFLPGISRSIEQLSFVKPSFMRLIASVFERSSLIRRNHPAVYYGEEGVEKTSFRDLMLEAFNTIKVTGGNYYQWGMFITVCLMIVFTLFAVGASMFMTTGYIMNTASAQLFAHPNGDTSMDSMNIATPSGAYNYYLYTSGAQQDWGIQILNKLFREGIAGKGGVIQNSFGALMEVYNTAVLTIAGAMILWIIVSVVLDTAKTGVVGGGRHNMVWAPIRIVLALGLIIPLGTKGFSAGQMLMIKLAEWGSNLGTTAWSTFVGQATSASMLSYTRVEDYGSMVNAYAQMWMCRVAYNSNLSGAGIDPQNSNEIKSKKIIGATHTRENGSSEVTWRFSNNRGESCGSITFPTPITRTTTTSNPSTYQAAKAEALKTYFNKVGLAFIAPIAVNIDSPTFEEGAFNKSVINFACSMAYMAIDEEPLKAYCNSWSKGACNEERSATTLTMPDYSCYKSILDQYGAAIKSGVQSANNTLKSTLDNKSDMVKDAKTQGWPMMGLWYYDLYNLTDIVMSAGRSPIKVSAGGAVGSGAIAQKVAEVSKFHAKWWQKMIETQDFGLVDDNTAIRGGGLGEVEIPGGVGGGGGKNPFATIFGDPIAKAYKGVADKDEGNKDAKILDQIATVIWTCVKDVGNGATKVFLAPIGNMFGGIIAVAQSNNYYPLTKLILIGKQMMNGGSEIIYAKTGIYVMGAIFSIGSAIPFIGGLFSAPYNIAVALVNGPIGQLMQTVALMMISASAIPLYYVPMLPFIKVAFSVLTWIMAVFEAVIMVPIAALSHITTQGDGLVVQKGPWLVGLNMLFRPMLTVIGFVGSILVLNTFVLYWSYGFAEAIKHLDASGVDPAKAGGAIGAAACAVSFTTMYCVGIYTAANASFGLLESVPAAAMKYLGGWSDSAVSGDALAGAAAKGGEAGKTIGSAAPSPKRISRKEKPKGDKGAGLEKNEGGADSGGDAP